MLTAPAVPPERKPLIILCVIAALLLMYATLWPFNPLSAQRRLVACLTSTAFASGAPESIYSDAAADDPSPARLPKTPARLRFICFP